MCKSMRSSSVLKSFSLHVVKLGGKHWQAAVTNFYAASSTDAQAQQLQLRQVHVAQALEEHASAFLVTRLR